MQWATPLAPEYVFQFFRYFYGIFLLHLAALLYFARRVNRSNLCLIKCLDWRYIIEVSVWYHFPFIKLKLNWVNRPWGRGDFLWCVVNSYFARSHLFWRNPLTLPLEFQCRSQARLKRRGGVYYYIHDCSSCDRSQWFFLELLLKILLGLIQAL